MKRKKINSHLSLEGRLFIQEKLNEGDNISNIARCLNRDRSNIGMEILKNRTLVLPSSYGGISTCIHRDVCKCRSYNCQQNCSRYEMEICDKLKASPHVCNNCQNKKCRKAKYYYNAIEANVQYKKNLVSSRTKLHYSDIELNILNNDFYCLVIINKSIYHSLQVINSKGYNFNIKSIYRQIKNDRLRLKSFHLPRANSIQKKEKIDKNYKRDIEGHTFEDYEKKIKESPNIVEWQMDCVQGIVGKNQKVFLTLQIVKIKFLFIFQIESQTKEKVNSLLEEFTGILKEDQVNKLIELLLTDNGHEFIDLDRIIEIIGNDNIYYCHPYSSFEKGSIENNHELIRRIIPKGVSLNVYNQDDIKILCSHVNSLYREDLDGKCPFDLIGNYLTEDTINKLGYKKIKPDNVTLIPELLGNKNIDNIKRYLDKKEIKEANISFIEDEDILKYINNLNDLN